MLRFTWKHKFNNDWSDNKPIHNNWKLQGSASIWLDSSTQIVAAGTGLILILPLPQSPLYHFPLQVGPSHIYRATIWNWYPTSLAKPMAKKKKKSSLLKIALVSGLSWWLIGKYDGEEMNYLIDLHMSLYSRLNIKEWLKCIDHGWYNFLYFRNNVFSHVKNGSEEEIVHQ